MQFQVKKISCALVALLLAISWLTGCSTGPSGNPATTPPATASAPASTDSNSTPSPSDTSSDLAPYTVDFALPYPQADMSDQAAVEAYLNDYLAQPGHLPNTKIHFDFYPSDKYATQLTLDAASGVSHDLVMGSSGWVSLSSLVSQGVISPMTSDAMNQYAPDIMSRIEAKYWPATTIAGQVYAVPNPFVYAQPIGYVFQKDLCTQYNFDPSTVNSLSDLEPFLAAVKAGSPGITPFLPDPTKNLIGSANSYLDFVQNWLAYDTKANQFEWIFDDPVIQSNAATLADFYQKGYLPANVSQVLGTGGTENMQTGKFAVGPDAGAFDATAQKSTSAYGFPTIEQKITDFVIGTGRVQSCYVCLSATSKNPERALMFLNYLYKDKTFANMVGYGKEGLDWNYVSGQGTDNPTVQTVDGAKWAIWICWISPLWDQWPSNWNSADALAQMKAATDEAPVSPILGFTLDTDSIKTQVASLQQLYSTASNTMTGGTEGDAAAYITQVKQQAEAAGLQQVLDEANKQLSAWQTANG